MSRMGNEAIKEAVWNSSKAIILPLSGTRWLTVFSIRAGLKLSFTPNIRIWIWCSATWQLRAMKWRCGIGPEGLAKFRSDLDRFLKETAAKNYSGKGAPRIVLFSPIAEEKHKDPNLPNPTTNNANIRLYSEAMREVANANGVLFVDLFEPSRELYAEAATRGESLTINGIHLGDQGDKLLAQTMFKGVFGRDLPLQVGAPPGQGEGPIEKLRRAINEKNEQWEARYRTVDGNNVYGGRSALAYQPEKG